MFIALCVSACVQSHTMAPSRVSDSAMSCSETAQRIAEVDAIKRLTLKEKNSKNIVAGVLFFPAMSGNQDNVQQTITAVDKRKVVLADVYQVNECVDDIPVYSTEQIKVMINNNQVRELQP